MCKEEWYEMYETKKRIDDLILAQNTGFYCDADELERLREHREKLWQESQWEREQMDTVTAFCFKARFYEGMSYRQIMLLVFNGVKCESCARKRISRWMKKWEREGVEREDYEKIYC